MLNISHDIIPGLEDLLRLTPIYISPSFILAKFLKHILSRYPLSILVFDIHEIKKMSFLTRTAIRSSRSVTFAPRAFSTSLANRKTATEAVKDTVKTVDRKVSDKLVDGIELGRKYSNLQNSSKCYAICSDLVNGGMH